MDVGKKHWLLHEQFLNHTQVSTVQCTAFLAYTVGHKKYTLLFLQKVCQMLTKLDNMLQKSRAYGLNFEYMYLCKILHNAP